MFSVRGVLCAPLLFDARFVGAVLRLRDAFALFEVVFVARDAAFAARPRTLLPRPDLDALAGDLGAVVFAGALLRDAAVLDTVFLAAAGFSFLEPGLFFAAGRPRALIPRPDLETLVFGDLAINDSFGTGISSEANIAIVGRRREVVLQGGAQRGRGLRGLRWPRRDPKRRRQAAFEPASTERPARGGGSDATLSARDGLPVRPSWAYLIARAPGLLVVPLQLRRAIHRFRDNREGCKIKLTSQTMTVSRYVG